MLEEIWDSIQFYVFLCSWNFLVAVCPLSLSLSWHFSCQCGGTNKNGTTMLDLGLEAILLVSILNHIGGSYIVYSRSFPRLFIHLGLKIISNKEDFLVEMCVLLSLFISGPCGQGSKVGNKWNNKSSETIFWAVTHHVPLVLLVMEFNNFCYLILGHSTSNAKCRLYLWVNSEAFPIPIISSWFFTIPGSLGPALLCRIISSSDFLRTIHHVCCLDGSCIFHQISFPYCAWGTNTNLGHIW